MNLVFYPDHIRAELDKYEFLEIVDEFLKENQEAFNKFCKET